jgi:hypothetical protein
MFAEAFQVLQVEGGSGVDHHTGPRSLNLRIIPVRSFYVLLAHHRDDVPLRGANSDRDHFGFRVQHMAGVVIQPLGFRFFGLRREGDRAAHLQDHLRHSFLQKPDEVVVLIEVHRAFPGGWIPYVDVQHGGPRG